ncbi:MAG: hypothetical protein H0X03_08790, partial [Nitrosopumilus sp.]|nr:hypothetical protein [Nitrosopumilus sp.]
MSNITKNQKVGIFAIFIASALMLGTISVVGIDSAYAGGKKKYNEAEQSIEQEQSSSQSSQCISGVVSLLDCNNVALQAALNLGNIA